MQVVWTLLIFATRLQTPSARSDWCHFSVSWLIPTACKELVSHNTIIVKKTRFCVLTILWRHYSNGIGLCQEQYCVVLYNNPMLSGGYQRWRSNSRSSLFQDIGVTGSKYKQGRPPKQKPSILTHNLTQVNYLTGTYLWESILSHEGDWQISGATLYIQEVWLGAWLVIGWKTDCRTPKRALVQILSHNISKSWFPFALRCPTSPQRLSALRGLTPHSSLQRLFSKAVYKGVSAGRTWVVRGRFFAGIAKQGSTGNWILFGTVRTRTSSWQSFVFSLWDVENVIKEPRLPFQNWWRKQSNRFRL